jgi:hypothetical protein
VPDADGVGDDNENDDNSVVQYSDHDDDGDENDDDDDDDDDDEDEDDVDDEADEFDVGEEESDDGSVSDDFDKANDDEDDEDDEEEDARVLHQGHLTLLGKGGKVSKRYFILTTCRLRVYLHRGSESPLRTIPMDGAKCNALADDDDGGGFVLSAGKRSVTLRARDSATRDAWIEQLRRARAPTKRIGKLIAQGDEQSYELIYSMLAGLRHAVGLASAHQLQTLSSDAFAAHSDASFRREVGSVTDGTMLSSFDFDFTDHAPAVFAHLRQLWRLDAADYLVSLTSNYALSELVTPGKSGSFFYFSVDMRFLFKTVTAGEFKTLMQMLPSYYAHVKRYASTLLPRFLGLHSLRRRGQTLRFVVMTNLFPTTEDMPVMEQYDLKGSTVGRTAGAANIERNPKTVRKDLDFHRVLHLPQRMALALQQQLSIDSEFLERHNIMDYSLLLGICPLPADAASAPEAARHDVTAADMAALVTEMNDDSGRAQRSLFELYRGGTRSVASHREAYYCGIIDILQVYSLKKQLEHQYKATRYDASGVSVTRPHVYAARFRTFLSSILLHEKHQPIRRPSENLTATRPSGIFATFSSLTLGRRIGGRLSASSIPVTDVVVATVAVEPRAPASDKPARRQRRKHHRRRNHNRSSKAEPTPAAAVEAAVAAATATAPHKRRHRRNVSDGAIKLPQ